ncbi:MAG: winged helix-turn-helix domain-containing protein [Candidatus Bathyarchaeota archaeon]|nr:winged helix-turn-helix domain-containing protein [Candidatus Bathyarchaeota archaeon]
MGIYREKIDIMAKILEIASGNAKKTQIMYQANLNYKVLQRYLSEMGAASLIKFDQTLECYTPTEVGHEFLSIYTEYTRCSSAMRKWACDMQQKRAELEKISNLKISRATNL